MAKWADYAIIEVRYNPARAHIDKVKLKEDKGDTLGETQISTRAEVVAALGRGTTFVTAVRNTDGKYNHGQPVRRIEIDGRTYIRSDANRTAADNLENLPEF